MPEEHEQEGLKGHWFVVHTLSGQEYKVQQSLEKRRAAEGVDDIIHEIMVPTERVSDTRRGRKTVTNRKFFPGYILIRMDLYQEDCSEIISRGWYFITQTQGVIGFVGSDKPVPLSPDEVQNILAQTRQAEEMPKPKMLFEIGETVVIKDGAFENFEGVIESVDPDRGRLKLSVTIFGRSTPVEVEYWQVERG